MAIIYIATNIVTNVVYIGQSKASLSTRKSQHLYDAFKTNLKCHFHRAIRRYGTSAFEWDILQECNECELNDAEVFWIQYFKYIGAKLYNMTTGGDCFRHSQETIEKLRIASSKPQLESTKRKISASLKGKSLGWPGERTTAMKDKLAIAHTDGKSYTIVGPDGTVYEDIINISRFAREHNLSVGNLHGMLNGTRSICNGYRRQL